MKKFLLSAALMAFTAPSFSQMMGGMHGGSGMGGQMGPMMMPPYGYYYQPMMPMMMMPMMMGGMMGNMGMMGMMHDPEAMKIIREHQMQCRRELMKKLAARPKFIEKMIHIMLMHPEAVKETLNKNPKLKQKMEELIR